MATALVLLATVQLSAGLGDARFTLNPGEELTAAAQKKLGIEKADIPALKASGKIVERDVRAAEAPGADDAANAETAAKLAAAEKEIADLKAQLAAAQKALDEKAADVKKSS